MSLEYDESLRPSDSIFAISTVVIAVLLVLYFVLSGLRTGCCPEGQYRVARNGECVCAEKVSHAD
jgi:hypothetical protein